MKTFLKKIKTSVALDQEGRSREPREPGAARRFEECLRAMDHELRQSRANTVVPTSLHASVMRAVQNSSRESEPAVMAYWWRRMAAPALVVAVGIGVLWSVNHSSINVVPAGLPVTEAPPSFAAAFDRGHELTQAAPKAVLEPLSGEMELLHRDFQNAVSFLAANMP